MVLSQFEHFLIGLNWFVERMYKNKTEEMVITKMDVQS